MIPRVNLGVGEMGLFMFCDFYVSQKLAFAKGYKFDKFALFDFCLPEDTSQSRNFSFLNLCKEMLKSLILETPCIIFNERSDDVIELADPLYTYGFYLLV